jgi:hypothetical protein
MAAVISLYNDVVNNRLVKGLTNAESFAFNSAGIYQGSKLTLRWYPLQPTGSVTSPFTLLSVTGLSIDIAIGPRAGAESILARQNTWVDSGNGYLEATLNLNTSELNTAIGTSDSLSTYFEIAMTESGSTRTVYQESISVTSVVIGPGTAASLPSAATEYLTAAQVRAEFVRFFNNPNGATIELLSPDGTRSRLMGVNDDGTAQDEVS